MSVLLLTGPPAAGKNTVAQALAPLLVRCAVVDVDLVRWMVLQPHRAPWDGNEGRAQQQLGVRNACTLAHSFLDAGFVVAILDVIDEETTAIYRASLGDRSLWIVSLLPSRDEILRRNLARGTRLSDEEVAMLYHQQARARCHDERIDNTSVAPETVAVMLRNRLQTLDSR